MLIKKGENNKQEELDEERRTCINQVQPLARNVFELANENSIRDPITVTHKCLIHKEENKFDLNWKGILLLSTTISRHSQINS